MKKILLITAVILTAGATVFGAGFSIFEQSAEAMAGAMAFTARADSPSGMFYNPAGVGFLEDHYSISLGLTYLGPDSSYTAMNGDKWRMTDKSHFPPNIYFNYRFNDSWSTSFGTFAPYGLSTNWDDEDFPGRYVGTFSEIVTTYYNPVVAYNFQDRFSFAFGLNYVTAKAELQNAINMMDVDAGIGNLQLFGYTFDDAHAIMKAEGSDWGWNLGFMAKFAENHQVGLSYRSSVDVDFDKDNTVDFSGGEDFDAAYAWFGIPADFEMLFPDQKGTTQFDFPATASVGYAFVIPGKFSVEFDLGWMEWSNFDALVIDLKDNTGAVSDDIFIYENWDDVYSYRLGAEFSANESWDIRAGAYYDESPVPDSTYSPRVPCGDRFSMQAGFGYHYKNFTLDFAYMALWFDTVRISEDEAEDWNDTPEIAGKYDTFVNLLGLNVSWTFGRK